MAKTRGRPLAAAEPSQEARRRILDAAQSLFAELGYDATPTKRIAEDAGVPQGLLFYYFRTKEGLLEALVAERNFLSELERELKGTKHQDPAQGLWDLAQRFRAVVGRREAIARILMRESLGHPSVAERFTEMRETAIAIIAAFLEAHAMTRSQATVIARAFLYTLLMAAIVDNATTSDDFLLQLIAALLGNETKCDTNHL